MSPPRPGSAPPPATNATLAVPSDSDASLRRREGPVLRGARHVWNVAISLVVGTMIGMLGHEFAADALARLWPDQALVADFARAVFWLLGLGAAGVLFFSYYLDDTAS
ncbi:hypothetical protein BH11PSE3_BH11PSE3_44280 [soil metagenome]